MQAGETYQGYRTKQKTHKKNPFSRSDKASIKSGTAVRRVDTEKNCPAGSLLSADTSPLPEL